MGGLGNLGKEKCEKREGGISQNALKWGNGAGLGGNVGKYWKTYKNYTQTNESHTRIYGNHTETT
ncbi:MAG: hypothetical protein WAK60_11535 [Sedimentisphaerales bacterium]